MTNQLKDAKKTAKLHGFTVNETEASSKLSREYRVNVLGGSEESAYYTNSLPDAVTTGMAMRKLATTSALYYATATIENETIASRAGCFNA